MGVENFRTGVGSQRSLKRSRVLLTARLQTPSGEINGRLRDLSRKGALLECAEPLEVDSQVVFARGDTVVPARVAWSSGRRVGLEFQRMIDESEVLVQLGRAPAPPVQQRYRRPRLFEEDMTEQDRQRARAWGISVGLNIAD